MSAHLEAEALKALFHPTEQRMYLAHVVAGKSAYALSKIHLGYEGENGVLERLNEMRIAIGGYVRERQGRLADLGDDLAQNATGLPVKVVAAGGAAPATPPSQRGPVAADTSSRAPAPVPAAATKRPHNYRQPKRDPAPETVARDKRVTELLREKPRSCANIAERLNEDKGLVYKALKRLRERGVAEPTEFTAYDYTQKAGGGPPATIWRLLGDDRVPDLGRPQRESPLRHPKVADLTDGILGLLSDGPRSQHAMALELEAKSKAVRHALAALEADGKVRRTGRMVPDWLGAEHSPGRPSIEWCATGQDPVAERVGNGVERARLEAVRDWLRLQLAETERELVAAD